MSNYQNLLVFDLVTGEMWVTMLTSYSASDAHCGQVLLRCQDISYKMVQSWMWVIQLNAHPKAQEVFQQREYCHLHIRKFLLIDNLTNGFDLYNVTQTSPLRHFSILTTQRYVKQGAFAEQATMIVCGTNYGHVYVFHSNSEDVVQTLYHDKGGLINCLDPHQFNAISALVLVQIIGVCTK
jgi:hypothetical protein